MLAWILLGGAVLLAAGVAGGLHLACRLDGPRRLHRRLAGARGRAPAP